MKVFDRLPHPYFAPEHEYGTDVQLCRAAQAKGFKVYLDSSIELGHVKDERVIITSRNKDRHAMESSVPGEVKKQVVHADVFNSLVEDAKLWTGYTSIEEMAREGSSFMKPEYKNRWHLRDWYNQFPKQRVARQVWFNTAVDYKRAMTEFILSTIGDSIKADILDFGCGIGIPAYELARRGHNVTALDLVGTGTIDFLSWRREMHQVPINIVYSDGDLPVLGGRQFGAVIAMDCLEHIPEWKAVLTRLVEHLAPGGLLFCNNGILDDTTHPEHIDLRPKEFMTEIVNLGLIPFNSISFMKPQA
jgi:SAM-dependent methyltransferase